MAWQEHALRIAAASPDPALQMRAAIGAHTHHAADIIAELCVNAELCDAVAHWLAQHWAEDPLGSGVARRHVAEITSPALRAVLDTPNGPLDAYALALSGWAHDTTVADAISVCADSDLPFVTEALCVAAPIADVRRNHNLETNAKVAAALWDRWERWYREGQGGDWVHASALLSGVGTALRSSGRDWYPPPPANLGTVGITRWWSELPFATPAHLIGSFDALTYPSCDAELAVRALTSVCEYTEAGAGAPTFEAAAIAHNEAQPDTGPANVAAAFEALSAGSDDNERELFAARLVEGLGDNFLAELDCSTARALSDHHVHRHTIRTQLARVLTERCGADTEAAIGVLVGGFSGTVAELCDIIATTGAGSGPNDADQRRSADLSSYMQWATTPRRSTGQRRAPHPRIAVT